MKILLFGEFSGFMNCLKAGLKAIGHDVFLASDGDGYKNFPSDYRWDKLTFKSPSFIERIPKVKTILRFSDFIYNRKLFSGYDIVLFITPHLFSNRKFNQAVIKYIIENNSKIYLSGAGMIKRSFDYWYNSNTKYHEYCKGTLLEYPNYPFYHDQCLLEWENSFFSMIDGYIPIWYEYAEPFRQFPCLKKTIRIPIDISQFEYIPNVLHDGKVVFYHGISRLCKGVRFIKPAFERMQKYYGDQAEFICAEKLPFDKYMAVIKRANVIVDDANSFSVAMNGLFSMLQGKLVMGGAEPIANKELELDYNPVYNICPDVDQICDVIKNIIENKSSITELGKEAHDFVKKYHNSIDIARQYSDIWETDMKVNA